MRIALIGQGIPYRDALGLDEGEPFDVDPSWALTLLVGLGMCNGGIFDWPSMRWKEAK